MPILKGMEVTSSVPLKHRAATVPGLGPIRFRMPVVWHAPLLDSSGYADEARHFVFALSETGAHIAARHIRWNDHMCALEPERQQQLKELLAQPAASGALHVHHTLPLYLERHAHASRCVGRTMFETDRLPPGWAERCNRMDAVWVPSNFNRESFARAGVLREKLRVVPGAIDLTPFRPNCQPLQLRGARGFNFLAIFDWSLRKGWDALLTAYVDEFKHDEDVALIIKTYSSCGYSNKQIFDTVNHYIRNVMGRDPNRIPDIVLQGGQVPVAQMPALYRAAHCYVMPTRGEGWGRPLMEAMAMELPTIATNWSGQTAFMNHRNSLLVDCAVMDVPEQAYAETPTFRGHKWAEPSISHLRRQMRRAFSDRDGAKQLGKQARAELEQRFTYRVVAAIVAEEIERLH